jgi:hypothetical protein
MRVIRTQVQYVNSIDRQDGEAINDYTITYPNNFVAVGPTEYVRMSLVSFATYNYFFWTNRYNNAYNITLNNGTSYLFFLPIGFYDVAENLTNFETQINAISGISVSHAPLNAAQGTYTYTNSGGTGFTLSFEGADPTYTKLNAGLLLGFNPGGDVATTDPSESYVPYSFYFAPLGGIVDTPCAPIRGELQNINLQISVPPNNVAFDNSTGYMNYSSSFAYIPVNGYDKFKPIVYTPQDTGAWVWQSPSMGSKLGTIRYRLLTPSYNELPMLTNYTAAIRVDFLVDDVVEQMKLMRESIHYQKLLLLQNDQHHDDAKGTEEAPEDAPDETPEGGPANEDQLREGPLDYYGNNLYYD